MGLPMVVGLPVVMELPAAGARKVPGQGAGAAAAPGVGACRAGHKHPIVRAGGGRAGRPGRAASGGSGPWTTAAPGSAASQDTAALAVGKAWAPQPSPAPPAPHPRASASSSPPPAMEEDITPHRSRLPVLGGPTGPSRIPGPPPRRDGPLSTPAASTKRSCLSVTLRRAGGGGGGPPWERLRGPAPITPVPPRPRPTVAEGPQRHGSPGGAEAAPAAKMGVPCSLPRSGGSPLP